MKVVAALTIALFAASVASANTTWSVGQEREVDEGYFFKLVKAHVGWRLWRIETETGVECRAVKSATGRPHPTPLGYTVNFSGGEPFFVIYYSRSSGLKHFWKGADIAGSEVSLRRAGEKFWSDETASTTYSDSEKLEVNIVTWEYPAVLVGRREVRGAFDMTGLAEMSAAVEACSRSD